MANDEERDEENPQPPNGENTDSPLKNEASHPQVPQVEPGKAAKSDAPEGQEMEAVSPPPAQIAREQVSMASTAKEEPAPVRAAYEHPLPIRITHWVNAVSVFVLATSGLRIFRAFPSFGAKIPEKVLVDIPKSLTLGGWLGGALQWHFTFMWFFAASGIFYVAYQVTSGHYRTMLFTPRDIPGVWPMARHYFFFGPKPPVREAYNPLQKQAYTTAIGLGVLSVLTGLAVWKPVQFSWLASMMGGFHYARIWHFAVMWAILFFVLGHLVMVILHGWGNFVSMVTGWKKDPEY